MGYFSGMTARNSQVTLIGKSISNTSSVQITDPSATSTYIADGEIVVLGNDGLPMALADADVGTNPYIQVVQRSGSWLKYSQRIDGQNVMKYNGKDGAVGQEQIYVVGYNNTSGSIDVVDTSRFLRITYTHNNAPWQTVPLVRSYQSTSTTQVGIVDDIVPQINADSFGPLMGNAAGGGWVSAERLTDSTITAYASTGTVVKGSRIVILSANTGAEVAGDYMRIGTATTGPVYKITSVVGTTMTLDTEFQGASATGVNMDQITAANSIAAGADWGIRLTGLPLSFSMAPGQDYTYEKVSFNVGLGSSWSSSTGSTTLTKTQEMTFGEGNYQQVAPLALMASFFAGAQGMSLPLPSAISSLDPVSGSLYDGIFIAHRDASDLSSISGTKPSPMELYIFFVDGAAQEASTVAILDSWMLSTPRQFPPITV